MKNTISIDLFTPLDSPLIDLEAVDGKRYMMDHSLQGCFCVRALPGLVTEHASVEIAGIGPVEFFDCVIGGGPYISYLLALKIFHLPLEYNKEYKLIFRNFSLEDGTPVPARQLSIRTCEESTVDSSHPQSNDVALRAARESIVLLKNEEKVLPCPKDTTLNVFGRAVHEFRVGMIGAGRITPRFMINFVRGIREYSSMKLNEELVSFYRKGSDSLPEDSVIRAAKERSAYGIMMISRGTSENYDNLSGKGEYYLSEEEEKLAAFVAENFERNIVVINSGYPIDTTWIDRLGYKAAIWTGLGGMFGGQALAEILEGKACPCGHLPDTWGRSYEELPAAANFYLPKEGEERLHGASPDCINTVYAEGLYVGYRYYKSFRKEPCYWFGHGLSYTDFTQEILEAELKESKTYEDPMLRLKVCVTNTGAVAGKDLVQVYAALPVSRFEEPTIRLIAFAKTKLLAPGESQQIDLTARCERFCIYDDLQNQWFLPQGSCKIYMGLSAGSLQESYRFSIPEDIVMKKTGRILETPMKIRELSVKDDRVMAYPMRTETEEIRPKKEFSYRKEIDPVPGTSGQQKELGRIISFADVIGGKENLQDFVCQMSDYELARICVCAKTGWGMEENGEAGQLFSLSKYGMPKIVFADGNNGVNIKKPNIGLPASVGIGATFDTALAYELGHVLGLEGRENQIDVMLAPSANLHRNPLAGRNAESFSEDPYLAGIMAGCQGKGLEEAGVLSCLKHFVANNCETSRMHNDSIISVRTLRELYLKVFEMAFDVYMPSTVMTSYNALNGEYTAASYDLIHTFLKKEMGFYGMVMTDWGSSSVEHPGKMIAAGNCWITPGGLDDSEVNRVLEYREKGLLDRETLEGNVYHMLEQFVMYYQKKGIS